MYTINLTYLTKQQIELARQFFTDKTYNKLISNAPDRTDTQLMRLLRIRVECPVNEYRTKQKIYLNPNYYSWIDKCIELNSLISLFNIKTDVIHDAILIEFNEQLPTINDDIHTTARILADKQFDIIDKLDIQHMDYRLNDEKYFKISYIKY